MEQSPQQIQNDLDKDSRALLESAIDERLAMTVEQRIEAHENARELMEDLKKAGDALRAESQSAT